MSTITKEHREDPHLLVWLNPQKAALDAEAGEKDGLCRDRCGGALQRFLALIGALKSLEQVVQCSPYKTLSIFPICNFL